MDFYNFYTVVIRKKYCIYTWQKFPPRLNNVLTLPNENENVTFHTFMMHSLNITRCIKLNDRPDSIIHQIEVWWVRWRHVWSYGLSFSNVCNVYETRVHDIDELRQRLLHVRHGLEQSLIDDAVDQWQTRLRGCVRASGGHFEHILWLSVCFLCTLWTLCFTPCLM